MPYLPAKDELVSQNRLSSRGLLKWYNSKVLDRTISPFQLFRQQDLFRYRNFHHFFAFWGARNNFGVIFSRCLHGFRFVYISRSCRLRWPEGFYVKFYHRSFMQYNHILNLRHTRIDFLRLKLGVISTAKTAHSQGANNESPKLYYKSYSVRYFYAVLKLWVTGKCKCNIMSIRVLSACTGSLKIVEICSNFANNKMYFYRIFELFQISQNLQRFRISISFLEIVHLKGCLGSMSRNQNFQN